MTRHGQIVPISVLGKRPLRHFDLRAEDLAALPILNRADNGELALLALLSAALEAAGEPSAEELAALIAELRQIVAGDEDTASGALEQLVEAARAGDRDPQRRSGPTRPAAACCGPSRRTTCCSRRYRPAAPPGAC